MSDHEKEPMKMDHNKMDMGGQDMMMHGGHMMHMGNLKQKFWVSLILSLPIILLSPMMGLHLPFQFTFVGSDYVVFILATILFIYGGKPFLSGARYELKDKSPAMMTLIAMAISVAYFYSVYVFILKHFIDPQTMQMDFFWELATLIVIMLLGHWIEMNAIMSAGNAVEKMASLLPGKAHRLQNNGSTEDVALSNVMVDDILMVRASEKIPADGVILEGATTVNESLVTGEAKDVSKTVDEHVIGGSTNGEGQIKLRVTGTGESGYLSQIMKLVQSAQNDKSAVESLADRVAKWLFYIASGVGILTFVIWLAVTGDFATALERMVTVLIIACPHALGLAIPLVVARSTSLGASHGLLFKNRNALELAKNIDTVLMDKTGTLTEGQFEVKKVTSLSEKFSDKEILKLFASLEMGSNHPLALSIRNEAERQKIELVTFDEVKQLAGVGLSGQLEKETYQIVNRRYLEQEKIRFAEKNDQELAKQGLTVSYLLKNNELIGLIAQGDTIKPEATELVLQLNARHVTPVMLTGDNPDAAAKVSQQLGLTDFRASLLPEEKEKIVQEYLDKNRKVMMVGDGVNDAPSLARATIGVAIGAGTDVAQDAADVVLVKSNPSDILAFLELAKGSSRKMTENLWWGAGYNIIAIPLAAGILAPIGFILSPAVGAILMSLSTVVVAINAMTISIKKN